MATVFGNDNLRHLNGNYHVPTEEMTINLNCILSCTLVYQNTQCHSMLYHKQWKKQHLVRLTRKTPYI